MEIQVWQIIALTILSLIFIWDSLMTAVFDGKPIFAGIIAGIIMGDITTGLAVGATLQLMVLGVGTYGGSSMPDYVTGAIVGTVFAVTSGQGIEFGIGLAVPVGLLMVNLDIFGRFCNVFFAKRVEAAIEKLDYGAIKRNIWYGLIPWGLSSIRYVDLWRRHCKYTRREYARVADRRFECCRWITSSSWYCDPSSLSAG